MIRASKKLLPHLHQSDRRVPRQDEYCNCRSYGNPPALYFYMPQALGLSHVVAGVFMAIFERQLGDS